MKNDWFKNIVLIIFGGDFLGMNVCICGVVKVGFSYGFCVFGIEDGY